jgi:hypothetical protein
LLLALLPIQSLRAQPAAEPATVFALMDRNEWCPGGSVYLDLHTGSFLLYPRLGRPACADVEEHPPVQRGTLGEAELQAVRSAYSKARRAGLRRDHCELVVSNGGPEALVITAPGFSDRTPENIGCWSAEASALQDKLFDLFAAE